MLKDKLKFGAPVFALIGLFAFAPSAHADPISACSVGLHQTCDLWETGPLGFPSEHSSAANVNSDWLYGYTFILDFGVPYDNTIGTVSDIVVIRPGMVDLYSEGAAEFGAVYAGALTGLIDGNPVGQSPNDGTGVALGGLIGLAMETSNPGGPVTATLAEIFYQTGCCDSFVIHSVDETAGPLVPEPATLTLLGVGGAVAAIRRRRRSTTI